MAGEGVLAMPQVHDGEEVNTAHAPAFNARVALASLLEDRTMAELCKQCELQTTGKIAIQLEARHGRNTIEDALARSGKPEIVNTDQDNQFTAEEIKIVVLTLSDGP
jgi:hypothetical protein